MYRKIGEILWFFIERRNGFLYLITLGISPAWFSSLYSFRYYRNCDYEETILLRDINIYYERAGIKYSQKYPIFLTASQKQIKSVIESSIGGGTAICTPS